jgi:hypothetical protein
MIKKIFIVFALALSMQLISGCMDCNCGPVKSILYTKNGLTLSNLDSSLPEPMITKEAKIASSKFGIRMQVQTKDLAFRKPKLKFGLIATANACKCATDDFVAKEDIAALQIFSNNDFDISHPKDTDLSLYFNVKTYNSLISVKDYIQQLKNTTEASSAVFYRGLFLQTAPTLSKKHKFRLKITLSDGRILEAETTEVELI